MYVKCTILCCLGCVLVYGVSLGAEYSFGASQNHQIKLGATCDTFSAEKNWLSISIAGDSQTRPIRFAEKTMLFAHLLGKLGHDGLKLCHVS